MLDQFLREISTAGVFVSAHPDVILKIGTKDILVDTQAIGWTVDTVAYRSAEEFRTQFASRLRAAGPRVLKRHRGQSGNGVWKVSSSSSSVEGGGSSSTHVVLQPAVLGAVAETMSEATLFDLFDTTVFAEGGHLVDQVWVPTLPRGTVRAYMCGLTVVGFGYQEVNALYPVSPQDDFVRQRPSTRHYYTESCHLFQPLRLRLEQDWLPALASCVGLEATDFPLMWDADFFLVDSPHDYRLCEINSSCVSPFPESAVSPIIRELRSRLAARARAGDE